MCLSTECQDVVQLQYTYLRLYNSCHLPDAPVTWVSMTWASIGLAWALYLRRLLLSPLDHSCPSFKNPTDYFMSVIKDDPTANRIADAFQSHGEVSTSNDPVSSGPRPLPLLTAVATRNGSLLLPGL